MEVTTTTTLLLDGLRDESNEAAWCDFDRRYRPIIIAFARRLGLNEEDAADVAQSTLIRFVKSYRAGQYDRTRGRLRSWIIGIVACRIADLQKSRGARREHRGDSAIIVMPADDRISEMWDEEHRREVLHQAFRELREQTRTSDATLAAFELFVIQQRPAAAVAEILTLTTHDVYMAKRRVTQRLRDIVARLDGVYADEP